MAESNKEDKTWANKRGEVCIDSTVYPIQQTETEAVSDLQPLSSDMQDKVDQAGINEKHPYVDVFNCPELKYLNDVEESK